MHIKYVILVNSDEKIIDYDPNDPNLVDEPYLDVENPYEGLGPGRPDSIGRALMPTAGRQSPDSIGQGKIQTNKYSLVGKIAFYIQINHALLSVFVCVCVCVYLSIFSPDIILQLLPAMVKIMVH